MRLAWLSTRESLQEQIAVALRDLTTAEYLILRGDTAGRDRTLETAEGMALLGKSRLAIVASLLAVAGPDAVLD